MAQNARQFAIELDEWFEDEVEGTVLAVTQKVAMYALSGVVLKSPVDTGRFRGNWITELGSWTAQVTDSVDKGGSQTINAGQSTIGRANPYQVVYLSNSLPYANRLENGWSNQAPGGMVAITVAEIEVMFE